MSERRRVDDGVLRKIAQGLLWEARYKDLPPPGTDKRWSLGESSGLDPDLDQALGEQDIRPCRTLDIGAGTGAQAVALAERGYDVTAIDVSHTALSVLEKNAAARRVNVRVVCESILSIELDERFDLAIDRGCFTILPPAFRRQYPSIVARLLTPGSCLLLKSDRKKGAKVVTRTFGGTFAIVATRASHYSREEGEPIPAWLSVLRKPAIP